MYNLSNLIKNIEADEISELLPAIVQRYNALFPDWEIFTLSINKTNDRNKQLDEMIKMLEAMKTFP